MWMKKLCILCVTWRNLAVVGLPMWTKYGQKKEHYLWIMWVAGEKWRDLTAKPVDKPVDSVDRWTYVLYKWKIMGVEERKTTRKAKGA